MGPAAAPGFFGKLLERGDFLCRRLPGEFVRAWDTWLQSGLLDFRERCGEPWLEAFLVGPVWRFLIPSGIAGTATWAGVLMPSVDRVGRYFPLTIAGSAPKRRNPLAVLAHTETWFDSLQTLALDALDERLTVEQLDAALIDLGAIGCEETDADPLGSAPSSDVQSWRLGLTPPARIRERLPAVAHLALTALFRQYEVWWTEGAERVAPSLLVNRRPLDAAALSSLYTGDWPTDRWIDLGNHPTM